MLMNNYSILRKNQLIQIHMRKYEEIIGYGQDMQFCIDSKHFW